jgi:hypothetical protein
LNFNFLKKSTDLKFVAKLVAVESESSKENMSRPLLGCFIGHFPFRQASQAYCFIGGAAVKSVA